MAQQTKTEPRQQTQQPQPEVSKGQIAVIAPPRMLPPAPDTLKRYNINDEGWRTIVEAIFPAAKTPAAVMMALEYCAQRKLDVFKRPVHIVTIYNSALKKMVETVWPGIAELRMTAMRTGQYGGMDVPTFGPVVKRAFTGRSRKFNDHGDASWETIEATVEFPEWCQITVYRVLAGNRIPFPGPRVTWTETYAYITNNCPVPNSMWQKRPGGQLEKCAEAAALRRAFPEELGNEMSVDEVEAFTTHEARDVTQEVQAATGVIPAEPKRSDYEPKPAATSDASLASPEKAAGAGQADTPPPSAGGSDRKATGTAGVAPSEAAATPEHDPETGEIKEPVDKSQLTDVEDLNESQPEPIVFEQFKRIGDFFMFSDAYLEDPSRTEAEVIAWGAFYNDYLLEKEQHGNKMIVAAIKDTRGLYDAALKRASNAALKG